MDLQQGTCISLEPVDIHDPALRVEGDSPVESLDMPGEAAPGAAPARLGLVAAERASGASREQLYQVIAVDQSRDRCWLRRWPLSRQGSPVFEISLRRVQSRGQHRPLPAARVVADG